MSVVAGRKKGTPNKATAEIKAAFQKHSDELVPHLDSFLHPI